MKVWSDLVSTAQGLSKKPDLVHKGIYDSHRLKGQEKGQQDRVLQSIISIRITIELGTRG